TSELYLHVALRGNNTSSGSPEVLLPWTLASYAKVRRPAERACGSISWATLCGVPLGLYALRIRVGACLLLALALGPRQVQVAQAPSPEVDVLLQRYVTAIGGQAAIGQHTTRLMKGTYA